MEAFFTNPLYWAIVISILVVNFYLGRLSPTNWKTLFEDKGDYVLLWSKGRMRFFSNERWATRLYKAKIVKIQRAGNILSLFHKSGHATDIILDDKNMEQAFLLAQRHFPQAQVCKI